MENDISYDISCGTSKFIFFFRLNMQRLTSFLCHSCHFRSRSLYASLCEPFLHSAISLSLSACRSACFLSPAPPLFPRCCRSRQTA
jgi:hypothetical protein